MIIHLKQIEKQPLVLQGSEPATVFDLHESEIILEAPLTYDLTASLIIGGALVQGTLETKAKMRCARCLEEITELVEVSDFVYLHEDLNVESFDLTPLMREDIILLLPQCAICSPDCQGLCPACGQNLNQGRCDCHPTSADPRWGALDRIEIEPDENA